ncbi:Protein spire [Eumeta japonica]|uniref:Protein spire n=1 Tax=Eumeta variegata TaxID=151549 RepID=A0A4C1X0E0_EUMVA|nr:Protein spire [Eumeta japonica]
MHALFLTKFITSCSIKFVAYDLATQCPSRRASVRRHTVAHPACAPADGAQSLPHSRLQTEFVGGRPGSRASCTGGASVASSDADVLAELSWSRSSLQDELIKSVSGHHLHEHKQWQEAIMSDERLSLTLEEIVHIRSVLTKAELEALPVEGRVKEDVEKRRVNLTSDLDLSPALIPVPSANLGSSFNPSQILIPMPISNVYDVCFLCLKTRFGIFGPWGQKCKLCKKTVCQKCYSKMRIPTEHFAHVPVALLSPSLLPSPEDSPPAFPRSLVSRLVGPEHASMVDNTVGSAPSSPASARRAHAPHSAPGSRGNSALGFVSELSLPPNTLMSRSVDGPESMPVGAGAPLTSADRRTRYGRSMTGTASAAERLRGVQMAVCHDCKAMVLQIIKSSRTSRSASRDRALRHLTLDLAPVYTADC